MNIRKNVTIALGVLAGNAILAFVVAAFVVPHNIIMGRRHRYRPFYYTFYTNEPFGGYLCCQWNPFSVGSSDAWQKICRDNYCQYFRLSGVFGDCPEHPRDYGADR